MTRERCAGRGCQHSRSAHDPVLGVCGWCLGSGRCRGWALRRSHLWRELVVDAWFWATHAWWLEREAYAAGARTEQREFEENHPRPHLGEFMVALSSGAEEQ